MEGTILLQKSTVPGELMLLHKDHHTRFNLPSPTFDTIPPRIRLWYGFCPQSVAFARRLLSLRLQHGRSFISSMPWVAKKNLRHQTLRLFRLSLTIRLKVTCQPLPPHRNIVDNSRKGLRMSPLLWSQHLVGIFCAAWKCPLVA